MHFYLPQINEGGLIQSPNSEHMITMRLEPGKSVTATDLKGTLWKLGIISADRKKRQVKVAILEKSTLSKSEFYQSFFPSHKPSILLQAQIDKAYLEKLVEVLPFAAFEEVIIFRSHLSPIQTPNLERLDKILTRSCEQAEVLYKPRISIAETNSLRDLIQKYRPAVLDTINTLPVASCSKSQNINSVLIGAEGGFSETERTDIDKLGLPRFSLGNIVYPAWLCPLIASDQL